MLISLFFFPILNVLENLSCLILLSLFLSKKVFINMKKLVQFAEFNITNTVIINF